jgi:CHAT domain-containing protein/Tfp pilus assembly protein PilF
VIEGFRFGTEALDYAEVFRLLENELIADYARGALSASEEALFERHFLSTPKRRDRLTVVQEMVAYAENERKAGDPHPLPRAQQLSPIEAARAFWWRSLFFPAWKLAVCAVLVIGISVVFWYARSRQTPVEQAMAELGRAYSQQRPIETRLSGIPYAAFPRTLAAAPGASDSKVDFLARDRAKLLLLEAERNKPTSEVLQSLGRFYLLEKENQKAIELFERALQLAPNDARIHGDLGAALLEKAKTLGNGGERLGLLAASLEKLNTSLKLDPGLLAALFNRGLVNEYLSNLEQARADWKSYLEKDTSSPWAKEAEIRLKELTDSQQQKGQASERLFDRFLQAGAAHDVESAWQAFRLSRERTGNAILARLLDEYLLATTQGNPEQAARQGRLLAFAGEVERQSAGDMFTADVVQAYFKLEPSRREELRKARSLVAEAKFKFDEGRFASAAEKYAQAETAFAQAGASAESLLARCWVAHSLVRKPDFAGSWAIYNEILPRCEQKRYLWLQSQALNGMADNRSATDFSESLVYAGKSRQLAEQIGDPAGVMRNLSFAMTMNLQFGDYRASLDAVAQAFGLLDQVRLLPRQVWPFFADGSLIFLKLGLPAAALDFQREALRLAVQAQWPPIVCRSHTRLGQIYDEQGDDSQALRHLHLALDESRKISLNNGQMNLTAYAWLQLGQTHLGSGDFRQALACFEQAGREFEQLNVLFGLYHSRKGRVQALLRLGQNDEAQLELDRTLRLYELSRKKIVEQSLRNSFFDTEQEIYDLATDFAFTTRHDARQAFNYAETSRSRSLLDLLQKEPRLTRTNDALDLQLTAFAQPLPLGEIERRLPASAQLVQYALLHDRIVIWFLSQGTFHQPAESFITPAELGRKVAAFRQEVATSPAGRETRHENGGQELYDLLIAPVAHLLDQRKRLCLVPEGSLNELPFAALISRQSGKYLIDEYALTLTPSASLFVLRAESQAAQGATEKLLVAAVHRFDKGRFPDLEDLPLAERQAKAIARLYRSPVFLLDEQAEKQSILRKMPEAQVIHLATHGQADLAQPLRSKLIFPSAAASDPARSPENDFLQAFEIYGLRLPHTRLVVLSACETGFGQNRRGEGLMNLARPFLAAGVPTVIASLWKADSGATSDLMVRFHHERTSAAVTADEALRRAQRQLRDSGNGEYRHPYFWAAFTSIGS